MALTNGARVPDVRALHARAECIGAGRQARLINTGAGKCRDVVGRVCWFVTMGWQETQFCVVLCCVVYYVITDTFYSPLMLLLYCCFSVRTAPTGFLTRVSPGSITSHTERRCGAHNILLNIRAGPGSKSWPGNQLS